MKISEQNRYLLLFVFREGNKLLQQIFDFHAIHFNLFKQVHLIESTKLWNRDKGFRRTG